MIEDAARYNIEPFFWSSSLSWIPSRFQEEIQSGVGDRRLILKIFTFSELTPMLPIDITITLTFLRSMTNNYAAIQLGAAVNKSTDSFTGVAATPSTLLGKQMIDPHFPLELQSSE